MGEMFWKDYITKQSNIPDIKMCVDITDDYYHVSNDDFQIYCKDRSLDMAMRLFTEMWINKFNMLIKMDDEKLSQNDKELKRKFTCFLRK